MPSTKINIVDMFKADDKNDMKKLLAKDEIMNMLFAKSKIMNVIPLNGIVSKDEIKKIISFRTGIPLANLTESE